MADHSGFSVTRKVFCFISVFIMSLFSRLVSFFVHSSKLFLRESRTFFVFFLNHLLVRLTARLCLHSTWNLLKSQGLFYQLWYSFSSCQSSKSEMLACSSSHCSYPSQRVGSDTASSKEDCISFGFIVTSSTTYILSI